MSTPDHSKSLMLFNQLEARIQPQLRAQRAAGEHFNLFQLCGIARSEVYTHSALLGELLNPKGSHGQGRVFLELFMKTLGLEGLPEGAPVQVTPEYYLGRVTEAEGGRLDLLIEIGRGRKIAIENKIDAEEQAHWVRRYRAALAPEDVLLYLTLDGALPEQMEPSQKEQVTCISYGHDMIPWLEACLREVTPESLIGAGLSQYLDLLRHLTHQQNSLRMTQDIVKTVTESQENFEAYCAIRDADHEVRKAIVRKWAERIERNVPEGLTLVRKPQGDGAKLDGFYFRSPALDAARLYATISFDSANYQAGFQGFEVQDPNQPLTKAQTDLLVERFMSRVDIPGGECPSSPRWPAWKRWPNQEGVWDDAVMQEIAFDPEGFDLKMHQVIKNLGAIAEDYAKLSCR